jgi:hypothetical protein
MGHRNIADADSGNTSEIICVGVMEEVGGRHAGSVIRHDDRRAVAQGRNGRKEQVHSCHNTILPLLAILKFRNIHTILTQNATYLKYVPRNTASSERAATAAGYK